MKTCARCGRPKSIDLEPEISSKLSHVQICARDEKTLIGVLVCEAFAIGRKTGREDMLAGAPIDEILASPNSPEEPS